MDRLTKNNRDDNKGDYYYPECFERCDGLGTSEKCDECDFCYAVCEKLGKYEDLEEQGRLVILPCKVGDTLYRVNKGAKNPVIMMRVLQLYIKQLHKDRTVIRIDAINDDDMGESCYFLENIGKTVFLTKSEAEAKLKELRGGEYD